MKRLLLISNIIIAFTQVSAQSVSYTYKPLAAQGCSVEYSAIWQEGSPYIVVAISSDRLVFNETPTMMIRTLNDELIKSEGKAITASTSQGGIIVSNVVVPVTRIRATAQFPITVEQIEMLQNGVAKVRISTIPLTHERTFKKDKIGKKLHSYFKKSAKLEENF